MQDNTKEARRTYRMSARAAAAQATYDRILEAAIELMLEQYIVDLTLADVAQRAGVTVQTVIRRFGTRAQLLEVAFREATPRAIATRGDTPPGDVDAAVRGVFDHYEQTGDRTIRALAQEEQVPEFRAPLELGRQAHRGWVERVFAPYLARRSEPDREQMLRALIVAADVYTWKLLRRDMGLDREAAEGVVQRIISGIVGARRETT